MDGTTTKDRLMKNWKSFATWIMFAVGYNFSLYSGKPEPIVYTTGLFTLVMGVVFVFRTEFTSEIIGKLIDNIKAGK